VAALGLTSESSRRRLVRLPPVARRPKGNQGNTQRDKIVRSVELA